MAVVASLPSCFLSTSTSTLHLLVKRDEEHHFALCWATQRDMEEKLPLALEIAISCGEVSLQDISSFLVDVGPGSFTGIRLGLSFLRGVASASQASFFPICSLDLIACSVHLDKGTFAVLRDAKRGRLYYRLYERRTGGRGSPFKRLTKPGLLSAEAFLHRYEKKVKIAFTDDAGVKALLPASLPLVYDRFIPSDSLFSSLTKRCSRLQVAPLYLQSFP